MSQKQLRRQRRHALEAEADQARPVVVKFLREAVDKLRREYARRLKAIRTHDPEGVAELKDVLTPCDTCAFRRTADFTDGDNGFLQTSCLLVHALDNGAPFYCHEPKQEGDEDYTPRAMPCIGWLTLQSPIPGEPLQIRGLLGDTVVDTMVEGSKIFSAERRAKLS